MGRLPTTGILAGSLRSEAKDKIGMKLMFLPAGSSKQLQAQ